MQSLQFLTNTQSSTLTSPGLLLSSKPPPCSRLTSNPACSNALATRNLSASCLILNPILPVHRRAWSPFRPISKNLQFEHRVLFERTSSPSRLLAPINHSLDERFQFLKAKGNAVTQVCVGPEFARNLKRSLTLNNCNILLYHACSHCCAPCAHVPRFL